MKKKNNKGEAYHRLYVVLDTTRLFLICTVIVSLLMTVGFRKEEVDGTSMHPTLKDGEGVIINVVASYTTPIRRFDVVIVKNRKQDLWVKRVIGLPGETIAYKQDVLYVNGKEVKEPFLNKEYMKGVKSSEQSEFFTDDFDAKTLESDEYLLMGDNRKASLDSRSEAVGPFLREQIIAKGMFVYRPLTKARYVGNGG